MKSIRFFNALLFAKISLTGHVFHRLFPNVLKFFRKTYLLGEKFRKDAIWLLIKNFKINNMVVTFCLPSKIGCHVQAAELSLSEMDIFAKVFSPQKNLLLSKHLDPQSRM